MADEQHPSLQSLPSEIRLKFYDYILAGLFFSCNWDMQPQHCSSCSSTHDVINVLRVAPAEGHEKQERRPYSLLGVNTKLRSETLPLVRRLECQLHVLGPSLVVGVPRGCKGLFELPTSHVPLQYLRTLLLDRNLPQLPDFAQLPSLTAVILPAVQKGVYDAEAPLPSNIGAVMAETRLKKSFMYKLGLYDFGNWTRRVWNSLEEQQTTRMISLRVRRRMYVGGTDRSVDLSIDMELHKAPDGRLGPERVTAWTCYT